MTAAIKNAQYLLKTRPPYNIILLGLIMLFITIETIFNVVWLVYSIPLYIIFYLQFCRYCCIVLITKQNLNISYIAPWNENLEIKIESIKKIDYSKGFYDVFSDKPIGGPFAFHVFCYDKLIIELNDPSKPVIELRVNTRVFDFDKILNVMIQLKLLEKK